MLTKQVEACFALLRFRRLSSQHAGPMSADWQRRCRSLRPRLYAASTASVSATSARCCASLSPDVAKEDASLFLRFPFLLPSSASAFFLFSLFLFSPVPFPLPSSATIDASATGVASAIFVASVSLATAGGYSDVAEENASFFLLFLFFYLHLHPPSSFSCFSFSHVSFFLCLHLQPLLHPPPVLHLPYLLHLSPLPQP